MQKSSIDETSRHYKNEAVVIDATGLGDPIVEDLGRMGVPVDPIKFTNDQKRQLIEKMVNWIELKRVHLINIPETVTELSNFTYDISETTDRVRYEAPVGFHDDIVIAHSLAIWRLNVLVKEAKEQPKSKIRISYEKKLKEYQQEQNYEIPQGGFDEWSAI